MVTQQMCFSNRQGDIIIIEGPTPPSTPSPLLRLSPGDLWTLGGFALYRQDETNDQPPRSTRMPSGFGRCHTRQDLLLQSLCVTSCLKNPAIRESYSFIFSVKLSTLTQSSTVFKGTRQVIYLIILFPCLQLDSVDTESGDQQKCRGCLESTGNFYRDQVKYMR